MQPFAVSTEITDPLGVNFLVGAILPISMIARRLCAVEPRALILVLREGKRSTRELLSIKAHRTFLWIVLSYR